MSQVKLRRTKTVSITSGKGGVGKTTLTANLAYALAKKGHKVLIFDGDLGMANIDIHFGVRSEGSIAQVLSGEKEISEVICELAPQISLIPGGSGLVELNRLTAFERRALLDSVAELDFQYDYLLIDTAPGISDNVLYLNSATQFCNVIITPDPSSLTDSYALIKVMNQEFKRNRFSIVCNQVRDEQEGLQLFNKFNDVTNRFLYIGLDYLGSMTQDPLLRRTSLNQRLILKHEPSCQVSQQITAIAAKLSRSLAGLEEQTGLSNYWEQVMGVA
jgi:flagellar biosynthesis protein FlhG